MKHRKGTFQLSIQMLIIIMMGLIVAVLVISWAGGVFAEGQKTTHGTVEKSGDAVTCILQCKKCCHGMLAYPDDWSVVAKRGTQIAESDCNADLKANPFNCIECPCS